MKQAIGPESRNNIRNRGILREKERECVCRDGTWLPHFVLCAICGTGVKYLKNL